MIFLFSFCCTTVSAEGPNQRSPGLGLRSPSCWFAFAFHSPFLLFFFPFLTSSFKSSLSITSTMARTVITSKKITEILRYPFPFFSLLLLFSSHVLSSQPRGHYVEDYHMLQGSRNEDLNRDARKSISFFSFFLFFLSFSSFISFFHCFLLFLKLFFSLIHFFDLPLPDA